VSIQATSGSFPVTGGNGNGTASGANGVAVVNGQTLVGTGNQFSFSDPLGSYSFTAAAGFTGSFAPVSLTSEPGAFDVLGGDGNGAATGLDALAEINGVALTGAANRFAVGGPGGQFQIEFAAGFAGAFDPITVSSVPHTLEIDGGDGAGNARGACAVAVFQGVEQTSADNRFTVTGTHGTYIVAFAPGFTGDFNPVTVASSLEILPTSGGDETGAAYGYDGTATINGRTLVASGPDFLYDDGNRRVSLRFQPGFTGLFDPLTITAHSRTVMETALVSETVLVPAARSSAVAAASTGHSTAGQAADASVVSQHELLDLLLDEVDGLLRSLNDRAGATAGRRGTGGNVLAIVPATQRLFGLPIALEPLHVGNLVGLAQLQHAVDLLA
jgi:hypothetical protein